MTDLSRALRDFVLLFERMEAPYVVMGGLAVRVHGIPRPTHDVDFTLAAPSLAGRRLTLSVRGEPVTQVLDAIALLTHARYEQVGRSVTFYPTRAER